MPRDLFGHVTSPPPSLHARKWYTVPLSLIAHVAVIVPLVLAPLLATDMLPTVRDYRVFVADAVVPPEPPPPPPREIVRDPKPRANPQAAPTEAPDRIAPEPVTTDLVEPAEIGVPGALPGTGIVVGEPPPPPPPAPARREPVRPGGKVRPPVKLRGATPVYPAIAQAARVQGTVILQAIIGTDGRVEELKVLRSIPLLDQAAIDAVRTWEYTATMLNDVPVSVVMTVTVTFTLTR